MKVKELLMIVFHAGAIKIAGIEDKVEFMKEDLLEEYKMIMKCKISDRYYGNDYCYEILVL